MGARSERKRILGLCSKGELDRSAGQDREKMKEAGKGNCEADAPGPGGELPLGLIGRVSRRYRCRWSMAGARLLLGAGELERIEQTAQ